MEHSLNRKINQTGSRLGFHYFPDHLHYRQEDLQFWVPRMKSLDATWLVLKGEVIRAIPEDFLRGLKQEKIEPIVHFPLDLSIPTPIEQLEPILSAYAKWGVRFVIFFEKPNLQKSWGNQRWSQPNLIAEFVDQFLPLAELSVNFGLSPVFPPLEPGGQYWDTVFLQQALEEMKKRNAGQVLSNLSLSAYAWTWGKSLNWGAGGTERWPQTKPYHIPPNSQDQRGLRTYEWYLSTTKKIIGKTCPVILLQTGIMNGPDTYQDNALKKENISETIIKIIRLLNNENVTSEESDTSELLQPILEEVICGNFWLLSCDHLQHHYEEYAWWNEEGIKSELAASVLDWIESCRKDVVIDDAFAWLPKAPVELHPISRYLYFPSLEYFLENEFRDEVQDNLMRYQPTIGFSLKEASQAAIVDIGADEGQIPESVLEALRQSGCSVRRIWDTDGKEFNEDYGKELADFPSEKDFNYAKI